MPEESPPAEEIPPGEEIAPAGEIPPVEEIPPAGEIPPPPWRCTARAVVWWQPPVTVAALVRYADSPVGPYREVFAGTLLPHLGRPSMHVPFIAVDSPASLRAGREIWRLPKEPASFPGPDAAEGAGWSVSVSVRALGPPLPMYVPFRSVQDGRTATVTARGLGRPALVTVTATGSAGHLAGRHAGFLTRGSLHLGTPSDA